MWGMKTKFFTGKGDKGTSAFGKKKLPKDDLLFDVLGNLDELNSWTGFSKVSAPKEISETLGEIQQALFLVQADVAAIGFAYKAKSFAGKIGVKTERLEKTIGGIDRKIPPIKKFILPGGSELSARLDVARVIARRAERAAVRFNNRKKRLPPEILQFLNRLSSAFFALARYANRMKKIKEENPSY